jgi:hypothetical protein
MVSSRFLKYSLLLAGALAVNSCKKETQNIVVRYEITSNFSNKYDLSYFSDLDVQRGTRSVITVDGGYWTANHIGKKYEPYYIDIKHDTASKPPYKMELYIIANEDTVEHLIDTTRFERIVLKGRKQ